MYGFCFDSELRPLSGHGAVTAYPKRFGQTSITRRRWPVPWRGQLTSWRRIHELLEKRNRRCLGWPAMGFCLIKNLDCQWCRMKIARTSSIRHGMMWCFCECFGKNVFFCSWERRADPITPWVRHAYKFLRLLSQNGGGDFLDWKKEIELSVPLQYSGNSRWVLYPPNCCTSWDLPEPSNPFHYPPRN